MPRDRELARHTGNKRPKAQRTMTEATVAQSTSAAPTRVAPGLLASALRIFDLSLGEMLWSRRTIFMALVVGGPVVIALVVRTAWMLGGQVAQVNGVRMGGAALFGMMIWLLYLRFTVPVLGI